ncbi:MAG: KUP/HAK/KT family potassium transporter [Beijerinckiaceae bacterium]
MASDLPIESGRPLAAAKFAAPAAAGLGALGIVYGDIGTSPLYALKEAAKAAGAGGLPAAPAVLGSVSLILWSLVLIVSLKYAILILRADNRGEGGIVAMLALLGARHARAGSWRAALLIVGLIGAALLYGDGAITPAISVLSAVEGLKVDAPQLAPYVVPITIVVLIGLFAVQRRGTGFIGRIFGPVMLLWFLALAALGIKGILQAPAILAALNPLAALNYLIHAGPHVGFMMLGAAFLAVTGGEAMYADLGHFGRTPIRLAWFVVVLPCLVLNYFGQGGLLLSDPSAIDNPFYQLAPGWAHYPLVVFATLATIIASQAIISGAFSLTQQAMQLELLPHLHVKHTASSEIGQIYMPAVNWLLALATIAAVLAFGSSDALAGAYGIAVSLLMAITTLLAALVARQWGYNLLAVVAVNGFFLAIDLVFFSANSLKFFEGGWFPLALALVTAFLMLTWRRGQMLLEQVRAKLRQPEDAFLTKLTTHPPIRLPGTAVFLSSASTGVPLPLTNFLRHNHALHERVFLVTVESTETPHVARDKRVELRHLVDGMMRIIVRFGFTERPNVPDALALAIRQGKLTTDLRLYEISYYIGRETIIPTPRPHGMPRWREALFSFIHRNSERSATYFGIPPLLVVEMGAEIEI